MQPGETYREDVNERELRRLEELAKSQAPTPAPDTDALDESLDEEEPDELADSEEPDPEERMQQIVHEAIEMWADEYDLHPTIETYQEAGLLTRDKGLVVHIDKHEFQITIVRSR
jgi:hypothetical protein